MTTATRVKKMNKAELADMAAKAMNLLMDLKCYFGDDFSTRQENDFNELAYMLPEQVRGDYWNNATLEARDIA